MVVAKCYLRNSVPECILGKETRVIVGQPLPTTLISSHGASLKGRSIRLDENFAFKDVAYAFSGGETIVEFDDAEAHQFIF